MILESLLGGLTGIVGSGLTAWFKHKDKQLELEITKEKNSHDLLMVKAESDATIAEAKANIKITQANVEGAIDIKNAEAFMESQKEGNKSLFSNKWIDGLLKQTGKWKIITLPLASLIAFLFGFVDFLRGIVRPLLTVYLCGVSTWISYKAYEIISIDGLGLTAVQATGIFNDVTSVVLFMTTTCVAWWFGDRRLSKNVAELKGLDVNKMDDDIKI